MKRLTLLVFLSFFVLAILPAQVKRLSREAIDSMRNRKVLDGGDSILSFGTKVIDFGTVYETDTARFFSFPFRNVSKEKVVVRNISANCGCIHSFCDKYEIEPGEEGCLFVKFSPKGRSGTVDKNIFVYTSLSDRTPVVKLTLLGNVVDLNEWRHLPVLMGGSLRLKYRHLAVGHIEPGTSPQVRIPCANVGTYPLRLSSRLLPDFMDFATEPVELSPGEEGDIVITIDGDKLSAGSHVRYSILVDGVEGRVSDRMIEIDFENIKE